MIDLDALIAKACDLEPLPTSVARLASLVARKDSDIREIIEVVSYDPVLTANLLRAANSAASASRSSIVTVNAAVVRLGTGLILSVAVGSSVRGQMSQDIPQYDLFEGNLWRHSVAAALAAEMLSAYCTVVVPPEAFTAALLHDIGKLALSRFLNSDVLRVLKLATEEVAVDRIKAETEVLQVHHGEVGGLMAQHWKLPEGIVNGIIYHHNPEQWGDPIGYVVYLANIIAKRAVAEAEDKEEVHSKEDVVTAGLEFLGMNPDYFERLCSDVREGIASVLRRYQNGGF